MKAEVPFWSLSTAMGALSRLQSTCYGLNEKMSEVELWLRQEATNAWGLALERLPRAGPWLNLFLPWGLVCLFVF